MKEVLDYAKEYFNCQTLEFIPLENEGGDGSANSHWDKVFLPMEYMNPTIESPGVLSGFTLKFLHATNWYQVIIFLLKNS